MSLDNPKGKLCIHNPAAWAAVDAKRQESGCAVAEANLAFQEQPTFLGIPGNSQATGECFQERKASKT